MPRIIFIFLIAVAFVSCRSRSALDMALELAGDNEQELRKVLAHYSEDPADSLKLRAAVFLIGNMPGHYGLGGEAVDSFYCDVDSFLAARRVTGLTAMRDSIDSIARRYDLPHTAQRIDDLTTITADYLIANIDQAFNVWPSGGFARHLTFDEFCDYILPYRVGHEPLDGWRDSLAAEYSDLREMGYNEGHRFSALNACRELNNRMREEASANLVPLEVFPVERYFTLRRLPIGNCRYHCIRALFAMRAKGIPVAMDQTPQWPYRDMGHSWNVVLCNDGREKTFVGADDNPDVVHKADCKMAKVYRDLFRRNDNSLAMLAREEEIPAELSSPFIHDVTTRYMATTDVTVEFPEKVRRDHRWTYLCVFDNKEWKPVAWGRSTGNRAEFKDMGCDVMYLPAHYVKGTTVAAGYPFSTGFHGTIRTYCPDTTMTRRLRIYRKYPTTTRVTGVTKHMIGGEIQASNDSTFSNPVIFYRITRNPNGMYITATNDSVTEPYRYWRHLSPVKGYGNIAELQFFDSRDSLLNKQGRIIGTDGSWGDGDERSKHKALDGDPLTFFDCMQPDSAWVGLEFPEPVSVTRVTILPRNDGNNIEIGDEYELFYCSLDGWASLGRVTAVDHYVEFSRVPRNAVLWLHNHTRGKEERIFTHDDGITIWW